MSTLWPVMVSVRHGVIRISRAGDKTQAVETLSRLQAAPENLFSRIKGAAARPTVSGAFRSVHWSGRRVVRQLDDGGGDPAPGVRAIVIAGGRELVNACATFLKRFVAVALHHQIGGLPDIDLGYHAQRIAGLPSRNV
jgi:hypothetical protein